MKQTIVSEKVQHCAQTGKQPGIVKAVDMPAPEQHRQVALGAD